MPEHENSTEYNRNGADGDGGVGTLLADKARLPPINSGMFTWAAVALMLALDSSRVYPGRFMRTRKNLKTQP